MKIRKSLMLLLASMFLVTACGQTSSEDQSNTSENTSENSSDSSSSSEAPAKTDWTDAEKQVMKDHLGGYVFPFVNVPGAEVYYDADYDCVSISSGTIGIEYVTTFKNTFVSSGFKCVDISDPSLPNSAFDLYFDNQENVVNVQVYYFPAADGDPQAFGVDAYLYPVTAWPSQALTAFLVGGETLPAPAGERTFYYVYSSFFSDLLCLHIMDADAATAEANYKATLIANNFTVEDPIEDYPMYYALSKDQTVEVSFYFDTDLGYLMLQVANHDRLYREWPTEVISTLFDPKANVVVPAFTWAEGYNIVDYREYEDFALNEVDVYCLNSSEVDPALTVEVYKKSLLEAGYAIFDNSGEGSTAYIAIDYFENAYISFGNAYGDFAIEISPLEAAWVRDLDAWPAEAITSSLKAGSTEVPAFVSAGKYNYVLNDNGIQIRAEASATSLTDYVAVLDATTNWVWRADDPAQPGVKIADSKDGSTIVELYLDENVPGLNKTYLNIVISNFVSEVNFDMASDAQLLSAADDKAVWSDSSVKIQIDVGESTTVVGNTGQSKLANATDGHSRYYAAQVITISVADGMTLGEIVFNCETNKAGGVPATLENATVSATNSTVTITPNAGVSSISFVLTAQIRVKSVVVNIVK